MNGWRVNTYCLAFSLICEIAVDHWSVFSSKLKKYDFWVHCVHRYVLEIERNLFSQYNQEFCYIKGGKLVINNDEVSIQELQELRKKYTKSSCTPAITIKDLIERPENIGEQTQTHQPAVQAENLEFGPQGDITVTETATAVATDIFNKQVTKNTPVYRKNIGKSTRLCTNWQRNNSKT